MLRIKIGSKRISIDTEKGTVEYLHPVPLREESGLSSAKKRGPQEVIENEKQKRLKMDCTEKMGCTEKVQCLTKRSITCQKEVRLGGDAGPSRTAKNCTQKAVTKGSNRGAGNASSKQASCSTNAKLLSTRPQRKCDSCGTIICQCSLPRECATCPSSGRSRDCKEKRLSTLQVSKPKVKSDGALSSLDDENVCSTKPITTTPVKDVVSGDGVTACLSNVEISPKKALRTAVLTLRYADLICKSQTKNLFNHCDKSVAEKLRQEKERLEHRQLEIKAMAESQIKATEAARQMEAEIESKQQREKLRQDARISIESMKKTVEIDIEPEVRDIVDRLTALSQCTHLLNYNGWSADEEDREEGEILYEEEREDEEEREEGEILCVEAREEGEILPEEEREEGEIF